MSLAVRFAGKAQGSTSAISVVVTAVSMASMSRQEESVVTLALYLEITSSHSALQIQTGLSRYQEKFVRHHKAITKTEQLHCHGHPYKLMPGGV